MNATDTLAIKAARVKGWQPFKYEATDNGFTIVHGSVPVRHTKSGRPVWATGRDKTLSIAPVHYKVLAISNARIRALQKQTGETLQQSAKSIPLSQGHIGDALSAPTSEKPDRPTFGSFRARG